MAGGVGCDGRRRAGGSSVATSAYPLAFVAEQVGGDTVDVSNVVPPGTEPHDVELTPRDVEELEDADLVLYVGDGFQPAVEDAVAGKANALDVLESADPIEGDPHVWLDPVRLAAIARTVGARLGREDAAKELSDRLEALDAAYRNGLRDCANRVIVTTHRSFGYLARRYGLEQVALAGLTPEAEPSARELENLADEVSRAGGTAVYAEPLGTPACRRRRRATRAGGRPRARSARGADRRGSRRGRRLLQRDEPEPRHAPLHARLPMSTAAVELSGLSFAYDRGADPVLRDVDLRVEPGEFVAIAGPNGGGKTTLLRVILGLESPSAGDALLYGEPAARFSGRAALGYVAQRARVGGDAPATVREVVSAGRLASSGLLGPLRRRDRAIVSDAIGRVGLTDRADQQLRTLSGGLQQRALIAKALAGEPSLLALDEPTTGVDVEAQDALGSLLAQLHGELGVTILYVSHEFGAVEHHVQRLVLVRGEIVFDGPPSELPGVWHDPSHVHA